jgi:hypothetical protein
VGAVDDFERRLRRAKLHLDDLEVRVNEFRELNPHTEVAEPDLEHKRYVFKVYDLRPIDPEFGLIAADFVNNLCALLDNLVWEIAPASLKRSKCMAFPVCASPERFQNFTKSCLKGLDPDVIAILERHQPYNRRPGEVQRDRLLILRNMWIADKHHAPMGVVSWAIAASMAAYGDLPEFYMNFGPFREGQIIGWAGMDEGFQGDRKPRIALDIGFKTRRPSMNVPRHALTKMYDIVSNEVVPDLRLFL